jgi:multidrug transporter EmrE-like cation transporter
MPTLHRTSAYLFLLLNAVLVTASEILLKIGATATAEVRPPDWLAWTGVTTLGSGWAWIGIVCYIAAFAVWLHVLSTVPLSVAFPIAAVSHVLIPLGSLVFLHEGVPALRWGGIALILAGVWLLAGAVARAEAAS